MLVAINKLAIVASGFIVISPGHEQKGMIAKMSWRPPMHH